MIFEITDKLDHLTRAHGAQLFIEDMDDRYKYIIKNDAPVLHRDVLRPYRKFIYVDKKNPYHSWRDLEIAYKKDFMLETYTGRY